ncbi:hypothetical protein EOA60_25415 [Mesorhizobium sp. M1A.F.Ca.IN.020.06.1.1]|uniref:hypothetical protein n=1 Tax=unclassified Mesorhizobium TaxID=325217 RepID=UPI000FD2D725|nr:MULTISPECIES: hypothetical protein [unclassified Mesorhizobium]RUW20678.1 hypothetical protein EOA60_25415 [Mesorhizobium sp. M1A.F.Ca.IN.020.06.1.1]RWF87774.1 MAG: hypothetical protein EOQ38_32270 [Mesorhizobium sp.]RWG67272.1 MAG: hypothetical protein EOQ68_32345 [Mesorhizobium sp.]RWG93068.1 MAG: hypothetical protein EOQ71_32460 [Mesorhizobium sp.]
MPVTPGNGMAGIDLAVADEEGGAFPRRFHPMLSRGFGFSVGTKASDHPTSVASEHFRQSAGLASRRDAKRIAPLGSRDPWSAACPLSERALGPQTFESPLWKSYPMNSYTVEMMSGLEAVSVAYARTTSPKAAAEWVTGRTVQDRRDETEWVRVTDDTNRAVYKFAYK